MIFCLEPWLKLSQEGRDVDQEISGRQTELYSRLTTDQVGDMLPDLPVPPVRSPS